MNIFKKFVNFFELQELPQSASLEEQRKMWFRGFLKTYAVVSIVYAVVYFLRYNFKAAQPLLKSQVGMTTTDLAWIGVAFSITYGVGRVILGYIIDGRNAKKAISFLLIISAFASLLIGISLFSSGNHFGLLLVLWAINGLVQSPGGPCSSSTINGWTPRRLRGRFLTWWNISHNVGGALAGVIALWGANIFFKGHVAGMFIFPTIIGIVVGVWGLFYGKANPAEHGWNSPEEVFGEEIPKEDVESVDMTKWQMFKKYVILNPWVWFLCLANLFAYMLRIGIDNWAPLYVVEKLHFTTSQAATTIFYLETGGFVGNALWGYVSDKLNGRRALVMIFCLALIPIDLYLYQNYTSEYVIYTALFLHGMFVFGPVSLIGVSIMGFAPKKAATVTNALPGTFGYIFGDSLAKILIAKIADPKSSGLSIFGKTYHGWNESFVVLYVSVALAIFFLIFIAIKEEQKIRYNK